jgi:hypothetical protein
LLLSLSLPLTASGWLRVTRLSILKSRRHFLTSLSFRTVCLDMSSFSPRRANLDAPFSSSLVTAIPVGIRQVHQVDETTLMSQFERAQQRFFYDRARCGSIAKEAY